MSEGPSNEFVTFRHLRLPWLGNSASVTAAIKINPKTEQAQVAFAFCSPKEHGFKKRTGRRIAESRLAKRSVTVKYTKDDRPRGAVARGLAESVLRRFNARNRFTKVNKEDHFDHWFPHWLLRSVTPDATSAGYASVQEHARAVASEIMSRCETAYEVHKAQVEEQKKRAAAEAATADG